MQVPQLFIQVIDFVHPYFDTAGISILLRKRQPEMNTIKFTWVTFKGDVWLLLTGVVFFLSTFIWVLERFSPYSYYNNKQVLISNLSKGLINYNKTGYR